jgi:hypothetical protein
VNRVRHLHRGPAAAGRVSTSAYNIECSVKWLERLYTEGDLTSAELAA